MVVRCDAQRRANGIADSGGSNRSGSVIGDPRLSAVLGVKRAKFFGTRKDSRRITGQPVNLNAAKKAAAREDKYACEISLFTEQKVTEYVYTRRSLRVAYYLEIDASAAAWTSPWSYLRNF